MESKSSQVPNVSRICYASKIGYTFIKRNDQFRIVLIKTQAAQAHYVWVRASEAIWSNLVGVY